MTAGSLALVGGAEFQPGNEPHDELLVATAGRGPAYVLATAAARHGADQAAANCRRWFARFGLAVATLPVLRPADAASPALAAQARGAGFIYLTGGDPGLVARVLRHSAVGAAIIAAWQDGAALAGSSAGAMAMADSVLVRESFPGNSRRRPVPGLGLLAEAAILPHHDSFGERWLPSARAALPGSVLIGIDERTCALWRNGTWSATGPGDVVVHRPDATRRFHDAVVLGIPRPE